MSYGIGTDAIATHTAEALTEGVVVDAPARVQYLRPSEPIASSQAVTFWTGFGFQSAGEWQSAMSAGHAAEQSEPDERAYVSRLWAEDWDCDEDSVYDQL